MEWSCTWENVCPTGPRGGTGPPVGLRPSEAEVVAGVAAEGPGPGPGPGPEVEEEEEKVLAKIRTGTGGPLVCRTTGLVTRKHTSLCVL